MSNYLCIATVTAALNEMVQEAVNEALPGVHVRVGVPRIVKPGDREVSLYLYQVTPNAQLRNADLPRWTSDGSLLRRPLTALNLHYIISFAGEEQLASERMLGSVVSKFSAVPLVERRLLDRVRSPTGAYPYLADSNLDLAHDTIQLVPEYLDFEQLSKLWTVFFQIAHRPSLMYVASPLMIDASPAAVGKFGAEQHGGAQP